MISNAPIYIGFDAREMVACRVAEESIRRACPLTWLDLKRLALSELQAKGLYTRPTLARGPSLTLWDELSQAPMSTEHAIARFFIPYLRGYDGWALFVDGDILCRTDLSELFAQADPRYAVQVVQHPPQTGAGLKKAGAIQTFYDRKNWSSVVLWNCGHPAQRALTLDVLNAWPGRDLHGFNWLTDDLIGPLDPGWNYLVNVTHPIPDRVHLAHFTLGTPDLIDHALDPFADEWRDCARAAGYRLLQRPMEAV